MLKKHLFFYVLLLSTLLTAQTVSTITEGNFTDALAIDSQGNLYGSDWAGNTVYKYSNTGQVSVFESNFVNPNGIAINGSDEIYICDHTAHTIYKYDHNGNRLETYTNLFITPAGIQRIPNTNDFLVVEYGGGAYASRIKRLAEDGTVTTLITGNGLNGPAGIAFVNDIAYIANFNDRKIFKFENNSLTEIAQLPSEGAPQRNFLGFMTAIDSQLIATHIGGNKLYRIDPATGDVSVYLGSALGNVDGDVNTARLDSPNGIIADGANDRIYISQASLNAGNKNLRVVNGAVLSTLTAELSVEVHVFPNPSKDSLMIRLSGINSADTLKLRIHDSSGREVLKKEVSQVQSEFENRISTKGWAKGIYFLTIQKDHSKLLKKIIIE